VAGLVVMLVGLALDGRSGLLAAAIGTVVVVGVLFSGALVVMVVAELMPSASLMVALMTYTLQMVLLAVVLLSLRASGWAQENLTPAWLAIAVMAGALVWTLAQVLIATRVRIPVYDLVSAEELSAPRSGVPSGAEGGAR